MLIFRKTDGNQEKNFIFFVPLVIKHSCDIVKVVRYLLCEWLQILFGAVDIALVLARICDLVQSPVSTAVNGIRA